MAKTKKLMVAVEREDGTPIHLTIRQRILKSLEAGELLPGDRLPSETEWATQLGVCRMTLSKAVLSLVQDGWLERSKGKGTFVANRESKERTSVGVVIAEDLTRAIDNYYFGGLYFGIAAKAEKEGFGIELVKLEKLLKSPQSFPFDGLIVINPPVGALDQLSIDDQYGPDVVILGASWAGCGLSCVDSENVYGGAMAVKHLAELGHRNLLFVGACPQDSNSEDRLRGFNLACELYEGTAGEIAPWSPTALELSDQAEASVRSFLAKGSPITAVVAGGAMIAMHIFRIATDLGLSVPGDLSIICFDDPGFLSLAPVGVTTLVQPLEEMVELATEELLYIKKNPMAPPRIQTRKPELLVRQSTSAPRLFEEE